MKKMFLSIIVLILLESCYDKEGVDISDYPITRLEYGELPLEVKMILVEKVSKVTPSYEGLVYSTDENVSFKHYRKNVQKKGWLYEVNNNDDYFVVDDSIYRKSGNNGTPYIYHKGSLYYGDLDIYDKVEERDYYKIKLKQ